MGGCPLQMVHPKVLVRLLAEIRPCNRNTSEAILNGSHDSPVDVTDRTV